MTLDIDATYSVEDNKLRLYASERLEKETYERVRSAGFRWAPKQELFVAPMWTPQREDLCVDLAGEITAEQTTLVERAENKAGRLDAITVNREQQGNAFHAAAHQLSKRFASGQPILVGHHSERKARRDQQKMNAAMEKSCKAFSAIRYWQYRATGVERHANMKANPRVRVNRIRTLLKELRDHQRSLNHAHVCIQLWLGINELSDTEEFNARVIRYAGAILNGGSTSDWSLWDSVRDSQEQYRDYVRTTLDSWIKRSESETSYRWINHILNRLAYETAELGEVALFAGVLSAPILQAFAREHGAQKPIATKNPDGQWTIASEVPLPAHLADGSALTCTERQWCELMQACGHTVATPQRRARTAKASSPLINPTADEASRLQQRWNDAIPEKVKARHHGSMTLQDVSTITQAQYSARSKGDYAPYTTITLDENGNRIYHPGRNDSPASVCRIRVCTSGGSLYVPAGILVLSDKPSKPLPIAWDAVEVESA